MRGRVLVIGGTGVFGGRLARLLAADGFDVLVAGRDRARATAFCAHHGGTPLAFDRDGDLAAQLGAARPAVVVDAAGPFQGYGADPYRVARAVLAAGAHYLDLADDPGFVAGIGVLDEAARARGLAALSGASTVPAISGAAADALVEGLASVAVVESAVLPGNRAPRGRSLVRAIVGAAGRPLQMWRGGAWTEMPSWSGSARVDVTAQGVPPLGHRVGSFVAAPDLALFPARYGAASVLFRAGLELAILHRGLAALAWLPRLGLLRSLAPLAEPLRRIGDLLRPLGGDRGGMLVAMIGRDGDGRALRRTWSLIVEEGEGPFVPALPACLLVPKLLAGGVAPGARPCLGELTLAEIERGLARLPAHAGRSEAPAPTLYERVLGDGFARMPAAVRAAHDTHDLLRLAGEGAVTVGRHPLARLARLAMRLPGATDATPVAVTMAVRDGAERWIRHFGTATFRSVLSTPADGAPGIVTERFGPVAFRLRLEPDACGLAMPILEGRVLGVRLPRALTPVSTTREDVDAAGRFRFDVDVSLPGIGRVVHYRGWLAPI